MQSSPASCHFFALRFNYALQHPVLKHLHSIYVLPQVYETKFHTHTKQQAKL
jgi:hypothetical protein